jgi:hypothetical protein
MDYLIIYRRDVTDTKTMERAQHILFHCLLQANPTCDMIVENFVNVPTSNIVIALIRRYSHPQKQTRSEILHNLLVY